MQERILLADDHGVVRVGLSMIIKSIRPQAVIEEADSYRVVLDAVAKKEFDLIILDINMPDGTFQQTLDIIKVKQPEVKVLVFSSQDEHLYALRYMQMGADGFLHKLADHQTINKALQRMLDKGQFVSEEVKDSVMSNVLNKQAPAQNPLEVLSNREIVVAKELIKGHTISEIAKKINIHVSTTSTYKVRLLRKLNVRSIPELIQVFEFYDISG